MIGRSMDTLRAVKSSTDGRTVRWEGHNAERRKELISASLRAIRKHGAGVSMDEIATEANTSRTVFYRHFHDRQGLCRAIVEWAHGHIVDELGLPDLSQAEARDLVHNLANAYLSLVEQDPEVYRFVAARHPGPPDDPVLDITKLFGRDVSRAMRFWLVDNGLDPDAAGTWGHGVVGFIWAVADRWIATGMRRPRNQVVSYIDRLLSASFSALEKPRPAVP